MDDLVAIGTHERSIESDALRGYHHLVGCEVVRRLVGPNASEDDKLKAARAALSAAILSLRTKKERLAGSVLLAADPDFRDRYVNARLLQLEGDGMTTHIYDELRPKVLRAIASYLCYGPRIGGQSHAPTLASERNVRKLVPERHASAIANLDCLVEDLDTLRHLLSAYQYVVGFDQRLASAEPTRRLLQDTAFIETAIWNAWLDCFACGYCCFGEGRHSRNAEISAYLPVDIVVTVEEHLRAVAYLYRLPSALRRRLITHFFEGYATPIARRKIRSQTSGAPRQVRQMERRMLRAVTRSCFLVTRTLDNYVTTARLLSPDGFHIATRAIAGYYGTAPDTPMLGTTLELDYLTYASLAEASWDVAN